MDSAAGRRDSTIQEGEDMKSPVIDDGHLITKSSYLVFWLLIISADIISSSWFDMQPVSWYKGVIILQNRQDAIWIDLKTAS